jgi:hypothetical protein
VYHSQVIRGLNAKERETPVATVFFLFLGMPDTASSISIHEAFQNRVESLFGMKFQNGGFDPAITDEEVLEALERELETETSAHAARAYVAFEFERALSLLHGISPDKLKPEIKLSSLIPRKNRRASWNQLSEAMDLRLPKPGTPPWMQQVLGFSLLAGMVLPFWNLWIGLGVFWGTVGLMFSLEKWLITFPYPTLQATLDRTALINPILEEQFRVHPEGILNLIDEIRRTEGGGNF